MNRVPRIYKLIAVFTALCLECSSISIPNLHAETVPQNIPSVKKLNPELLKLPAKFGEVVESHAGNGNVIVVQDAHAIPDAQKNIANVIKYMQQEYGVGTVALEGASGDLDPQIFRSFPDKKLLRDVMKGYMDAGEIAGGTAAAIFDETATKYQGVEDWDVYEEGLGLYLSAMDKTAAIEAQLSALREKLNKEKEAIYPRALLEVDREIEKFYENAAQLTELIKVLGAIQAPKAGSELEAVWKEVQKTSDQRLTTNGKDIEVRELARKVEKVLKNPGAVKAFNSRKQEWMTGQISPEAFALNLKEFADQSGLNLEMSSDLLGMVRDQQTLKGLEGTKLFRDLELYIHEVKMQLTQRQQTDVSASGVNAEMSAIQALDERTNSLRVLTKLSKLELSRQEWTNLSGNLVFEAFAALGLKQEDFLFHLAFYLNAEERDQIFFDNLKASVTGPRSAVIVAGGFHAEGITSRLKEAGMGYALVMPKINHIPENNSYKAQMRGEVSWKEYFEVENGRIHLYKAFVRATRDRLLGVGSEANVMMMKAWRDQIIRDLSDMGKVNRAAWYTRYMDEVVDESLKHTDADKLMSKVDNFIRGLRGLEKANQLNSEQIAALLKANMIPSAYVIPSSIEVLTQEGLREVAAGVASARAVVFEGRRFEVSEPSAGNSIVQANRPQIITPDQLTTAEIDQYGKSFRSELRILGLVGRRGEVRKSRKARWWNFSSPKGGVPAGVIRRVLKRNNIPVFYPNLSHPMIGFVLTKEGRESYFQSIFQNSPWEEKDVLDELAISKTAGMIVHRGDDNDSLYQKIMDREAPGSWAAIVINPFTEIRLGRENIRNTFLDAFMQIWRSIARQKTINYQSLMEEAIHAFQGTLYPANGLFLYEIVNDVFQIVLASDLLDVKSSYTHFTTDEKKVLQERYLKVAAESRDKPFDAILKAIASDMFSDAELVSGRTLVALIGQQPIAKKQKIDLEFPGPGPFSGAKKGEAFLVADSTVGPNGLTNFNLDADDINASRIREVMTYYLRVSDQKLDEQAEFVSYLLKLADSKRSEARSAGSGQARTDKLSTDRRAFLKGAAGVVGSFFLPRFGLGAEIAEHVTEYGELRYKAKIRIRKDNIESDIKAFVQELEAAVAVNLSTENAEKMFQNLKGRFPDGVSGEIDVTDEIHAMYVFMNLQIAPPFFTGEIKKQGKSFPMYFSPKHYTGAQTSGTTYENAVFIYIEPILRDWNAMLFHGREVRGMPSEVVTAFKQLQSSVWLDDAVAHIQATIAHERHHFEVDEKQLSNKLYRLFPDKGSEELYTTKSEASGYLAGLAFGDKPENYAFMLVQHMQGNGSESASLPHQLAARFVLQNVLEKVGFFTWLKESGVSVDEKSKASLIESYVDISDFIIKKKLNSDEGRKKIKQAARDVYQEWFDVTIPDFGEIQVDPSVREYLKANNRFARSEARSVMTQEELQKFLANFNPSEKPSDFVISEDGAQTSVYFHKKWDFVLKIPKSRFADSRAYALESYKRTKSQMGGLAADFQFFENFELQWKGAEKQTLPWIIVQQKAETNLAKRVEDLLKAGTADDIEEVKNLFDLKIAHDRETIKRNLVVRDLALDAQGVFADGSVKLIDAGMVEILFEKIEELDIKGRDEDVTKGENIFLAYWKHLIEIYDLINKYNPALAFEIAEHYAKSLGFEKEFSDLQRGQTGPRSYADVYWSLADKTISLKEGFYSFLNNSRNSSGLVSVPDLEMPSFRSEARSADSGQARDSYERYKLLSGTLADLPDPVFVNDGETITLRIPHDEVEGSQPELDLLVVFKKFNGKVFFAHLESFSDLSMLEEYYRSADPLQEGSRVNWEEVNETSEVEIIGREEEMDSEGTKVKIVFSEQGFTIANASISDVYYFEGKPGPEIIASALRDSYLSSASTGLPIATEPIFIAGEDATEIFNLVTEFINQGPYVPAAGETALYTKVKQQIRLITERTGEKYRFNPMIQINALSDTYRALNNFLMNRFTDLEGLEKGVVILKRIPNLEKLIEVLRHLISAYELAFNHLENSTIEIEVDEKENHRRHALQMLVELKKIVNSYDSIPPAERPRAEIQGEVRMARLPSQKNFSEFISYNGDKIPLWAIKRIYLPDNRVIQFGEISQANNEDGVYDREDRTRDVRNALSPFPESAEIVFELQDGVLLKRILEAEEYETITAVYPVDFDPKEFSRLPHGIDLPERRFINAVNVNGFITTLYELESLLPETGLAGRTVTFFYSANNHLQAFKISDEAKPQSEQYVYSQFRNSSNVQPMSAPFSAQETQEIAKKDLVDLFADLFNRRALTSAQRVVPLSALILQFLAVSLNAKAVSDWAQEGKVPLFEVELANEQTISFSGLNPALHHDDAVRIERLLSQIDGGLDAASFRIVLAPAGPATQSNQAGQFFDRPGRGLDEFNAWHKLSDVLELFFLSVGETGKDKKLDAASKQKLLDKLAVLVEAIAMIHPSVTGSEIYHTLYAVMDASMFRAKKLDTGSRINVLINLARQIRAAAPQDPQQSIYVQGEFESKLKTPNLDLNELAKETARSEARSADSGQAREAEAVAGDVFGFFKSPADYSADQINTLADEIDTLADKQGLDVFVNLLRSIARDLAVVSVQGSENILSKEATSFAVKLFVGRMMAAKRQSTLIDVKIEKPTIALALKLNDAQKASLGDKLSSELAEILGAVQIEAKDFKELGAFFKSVGVLVTTIDPDLANAVVLESFGADWSGLPAVGVLEESQQFDSELEGMRIYLQLLIAAYLARSFPDKKVILTPEIVGEINKLLFQSDAGQEGIVQIQNGQLVVKRSSLLAYIQTLFAAQSAVAVAA